MDLPFPPSSADLHPAFSLSLGKSLAKNGCGPMKLKVKVDVDDRQTDRKIDRTQEALVNRIPNNQINYIYAHRMH